MLHRKVQCWIFGKTDEEIYCLLLKTNVVRGSFWQPVTGTVETGEGYFEAACREPAEETAFRFESAPIDIGFEFDFSSRLGHAREHVFALTVEGKPEPRLDPKEHQDYQWTKPAEALKLLRYPSNLEGLKKSYEKLFGKELS